MILSIWRLLRPSLRRPVRGMVILAVASAISGVAEASVLVIIVNAALTITSGDASAAIDLPIYKGHVGIGGLLWTGGALGMVLALFHTVIAYLSAVLSSEVLHSTRQRAIDAYGRASWPAQSREREGSLQETVSTLAVKSSALALYFVSAVSIALSLLALLLMAALVDVISMIVVLLFGLLLFAALRPLSLVTRRRAQSYVAASSELAEDVTRMASMAMELRLFGVQGTLGRELERSNVKVARRMRSTRFASRFGSTLYRDIALLFLLAAVTILHLSGGGQVSQIGAVVLLIVRSLAYAAQLQSTMQQINEEAPNLLMLESRLADMEEAQETTGSTRPVVPAEMRIVDASYEYETGVVALRDVNLTMAAGEAVGIVGPSGSGKSTLLQLLLRLRLPTSGQIYYGELPYQDIEADLWSRIAALVPQEPKLMEATIADNIRFLRDGISDEEVRAAADAAHVGKEIRRLTNGFDTMLGARGSGLSGGQKQRVAIARALVGHPHVLVLDEPTSALDSQSEQLLQETIRDLRGRITIVIVAHRLSTLDVCDRLLHIRDGVLIAGAETRPVLASRPSAPSVGGTSTDPGPS